jgi:pimeloyl-ACP methyl ester carboxylesterase
VLAATLLAFLAVKVTAAHESPRLAMDIIGHGPVAVFESGLGEGRESWKAVAPALARCLTVVTYDRRGIRESPPLEASTKPVLAANVARDLLAALRAHGLAKPYILVGHSLGGLYVQAFARNYPKAVAGLVLVDATSPLEPPNVFVSTVPPKAGSVEAAEEAGVAPSVAAIMAGPPLPPVPLVVIAATNHGDTPERESLWRDVQRRTAALSPKRRLVVVNSGHFVQIERPAAVVAAVLAVAAQSGADIAACKR